MAEMRANEEHLGDTLNDPRCSGSRAVRTRHAGARLARHAPLLALWRRLGPGLVTGAADDDPSGIGTHSQIGAQFGFGLSWTFLFSFPLMVVIQEVAAEIGSVTGRGIAHNLRRHYSPWLLRGVVALLLIANIINLGADLGAMGAALTSGDAYEGVVPRMLAHLQDVARPANSLSVASTVHRPTMSATWCLTLRSFSPRLPKLSWERAIPSSFHTP